MSQISLNLDTSEDPGLTRILKKVQTHIKNVRNLNITLKNNR